MKNILMSTAAIAGLALVAAAPARADEPALQLGLGGYISGYAVYTDQDDAAAETREFDFRKDTEIHLNGEVALDNGITAGAHLEILADRANDSEIEESYLYMSSSWGRVNLGEEDGIAYLLQVGAPSADDKIDGIRPDIGTFTTGLGGTNNNGGTIDYAQDPTGYANKLTYITPVFNGFQAGASFTPSVTDADLDGLSPAAISDDGELENAWEVAARYEGSFDAIDLAIGAGYSKLSTEDGTVAGDDDLDVWNVGANIGFGAFGFGAAFMNSEGGLAAADDEMDTMVAGIDYTTGPYKLGASYLNLDGDVGGVDVEADRWTAGVIYEWGPGMTFRGAVQFQDAEAGAADGEGTQVTLGTQLEF